MAGFDKTCLSNVDKNGSELSNWVEHRDSSVTVLNCTDDPPFALKYIPPELL